MSNYFEHEPQATNVANQVENLATEVEQAFLKVEDDLFKDDQKNASVNSSVGSLDNNYIKEYVPNKGWIDNYQQALYFPTNSQSASLDLYPSTLTQDLNNVSITNQTNPSKSYTYSLNGILTSDTDFTFVERKVVFGKAPEENETLVITYKGFNTTTPTDSDDWVFELRYNVLQVKQPDNTIANTFLYSQTSVGEYTASGFDFKSLCSTFIQGIINNKPQDLEKYVSIFDGETRVDTTAVQITNSYVRFNTTDVLSSPTIKIYVANSSIGKLLEGLYRLFYAHDHGSNGGQGVNHGSLLGLHKNEEDSGIQYQTSEKTNYDHPQYLNREGFIQDSTVYNNSILGDLLLASTTEGNRRNNLDANSVKLIFGEYNSGHKIYFDYNDDSLWIDSISRDGVRFSVPKEKRAISVNEHSFVDTQYITSQTNNALKLSVKADKGEDLGVFKITRKVTSPLGVTSDDDKALLLSYASEYSISLIKDNLVINNGAKISFGDPGVIELVLRDDGLHFTADIDGSATEVSTINFDLPTKTKQASIDHLDAKAIHLTEDQKIVFGETDHVTPSSQHINFENGSVVLKTSKPVVFKGNGRESGLSLDNRQAIYTATPQGFPINDSGEVTDLFVEAKRDTYFLKSGYTFVPGVTSLHKVPRSNIYADEVNADNLKVNYDDELINGIELSTNNKIFAQKDSQNNIPVIVKSNAGLVVVTNYNPVGPILNYGKVTAKTFIAEGNKESDAGFYGNVIVPLNSKLTINGVTEFNSEIDFIKPVKFSEKVSANLIETVALAANTLTVTDKATYNALIADTIEVTTELRFSTMLQTNHVANSRFEGTVQFNNNVTIPNGNNFLLIGNSDIEDKRNTSGLLLKSDEVRLGVGGLVSAGKVLSGKGSPSGNGDRTGGFAFATSTGEPDGDTGLFCENNIEDQNNSDLVFRVDGVEKGRIPKTPVDLSALSLEGQGTVLVTVSQLLEQVRLISSGVLEKVYPIGSVYENSIDGRSPAILLDWPTSVWRRYAVGRSLMGAAGTGVGELVDSFLTVPAGLNLNTTGSKFGDYTHKLIKQELPSIKPEVQLSDAITSGEGPTISSGGGLMNLYDNQSMKPLGEDVPHNNIHPVIVTHIWERIG